MTCLKSDRHSVTKRAAAVAKPLKRIMTINMKRYLMAVIVLWTSSYINAGTAPVQEPVDREVIAKIRDEGLNRSQALETFTHFTEVIGPRLTATPAYKNAAEWARDKLKEWGLENPRLEAWEFGRGWTLEKFTVEMVEPRYMPWPARLQHRSGIRELRRPHASHQYGHLRTRARSRPAASLGRDGFVRLPCLYASGEDSGGKE